jgi:hypothetical protein
MWVDGEPIEARILGADEARQTYEEIVRTLRDPALLEYIGQDAIQASVFPIQPHDEARIEIEYSHILGVEGGLVRYVYPLRTDQLSPLPVGDLAVSVNVTSNDAIGTIYYPTHDIAMSREDDFEFSAGYETTNADTFSSNPDNSDEANLTGKLAWRISWDIPEMTAETAAAVEESDTDKRRQMYIDIQKKFQQTAPFIPMFQKIEQIGRRANVQGFVTGSAITAAYYWTVTK